MIPGTFLQPGIMGGSIQPVTWNPADKGTAITLSNGNRTATSSTANSVRGTSSRSAGSGKFYFEGQMGAGGLTCYFGVALATASLSGNLGFVDSNGWGWRADGNIYNGGVSIATISAYSTSDVIGAGLDTNTNVVTWYLNGVSAGTTSVSASPLFPGLGTNGVLFTLSSAPIYIPAGYTVWT